MSLRFDVFIGYSSEDRVVAELIAERLTKEGLLVWLDDPKIAYTSADSKALEQALEMSRVLILCISNNSPASDWPRLETLTLRFRDPLNSERRFIPLRIDSVQLPIQFTQFHFLDWSSDESKQNYLLLLKACGPASKQIVSRKSLCTVALSPRSPTKFVAYDFSKDGTHALSAGGDGCLRLWNIATGKQLRILNCHRKPIRYVDLSDDARRALVCTVDDNVRLLDIENDKVLVNFGKGTITQRQMDCYRSLAAGQTLKEITVNLQIHEITANSHLNRLRKTLQLPTRDDLRSSINRFYNATAKAEPSLLQISAQWVPFLAWEIERQKALSGAADTEKNIRLCSKHGTWLASPNLPAPEHWSIGWKRDRKQFLYGSHDTALRLVDISSGKCLRILEGHTGPITSVSWNSVHDLALSSSSDHTVRLWDVAKGQLLAVFTHSSPVIRVSWGLNHKKFISGDISGTVQVWEIEDELINPQRQHAAGGSEQIKYTNAKVLLVGESGSGKTGLSKRLALGTWQASDSTVGAWATQWKLPLPTEGDAEKEIWLWDFGGQADQRLIHQLYMDETALAVLVFDGQKENVFDTLSQWDRDLSRATHKRFTKLLVAGRIDAGGIRCNSRDVERFATEHQYQDFLQTSAKTNRGCDGLKQAIISGINWDDLPCRTTEVQFKRLKEEIVRLKDEGHVIMRFKELRDLLQLRARDENCRFDDSDLRAVLLLLTSPGVVWELKFGSWVLLQPERINSYAQAVIQTLRQDEHQRGCILEERVLQGDLIYESSMPRLGADDERFVLLAMHQILIERGLCFRQPTSCGNLLIFPSYYRLERPEQENSPEVLVSYRFQGFLDEIYATLVVRLHHTEPFHQDQLWHYAADFKTNLKLKLGFKLKRHTSGSGEIDVYFDHNVSIEERIIFSKYIHEHLIAHATDVERFRYYVCTNCKTPVRDREIAAEKLSNWLLASTPGSISPSRRGAPSIVCVRCEKRVPLWDDLETLFSDIKSGEQVLEMQKVSALVLDNESKERALVGEVISAVALAGQLSRELNVSDHGIDMEIEFKNDSNEATGKKIYLQLKSGDSYLRKRKEDGVEVFTISKKRHVEYWVNQQFPVLLVIMDSKGGIRWMEIRDFLRRKSQNGTISVNQIPFEGERFDILSIRRWRDRMLET